MLKKQQGGDVKRGGKIKKEGNPDGSGSTSHGDRNPRSSFVPDMRHMEKRRRPKREKK